MTRRVLAWLAAIAAGCGAVGGGAFVLTSPAAAAHAQARPPRVAGSSSPTLAVTPGQPGPPGLPALPVSGAALYAPRTGQLLLGEDATRRLAVASTTKLMTALVTLERVHQLRTVFTQNDFYAAAIDSQIGLVPGERMSVHDLLIALMLPSADDAAEDLAYNVGGGSVARFVAMMNAEARRLGLRDTHYSTPSGLDTPGNYSSAADLVRLAAYDMAHSAFFRRIVALRRAVLRTGSHVRDVVNLNDLVDRFAWIDGVKTGHTSQAGYVLVGAGHRDGMPLISAVLGTPTPDQRDASTLALLRYGFAAFRIRRPVLDGERLADPTVQDQPGVRADVRAASAVAQVLPRGARLRVRVQVPRQLVGPLPAEAIVGTATVLDGNRVIATVALVLHRRLAAVSGLTLAVRFITQPLTLVVIAVILGIGIGSLLWRRSRRRRRRSRRREGRLEAA